MLPHVYPIDFPLNPSLDLPGPPYVRHAPCGLSRGLPAAVRSPSLSLRQRDRGGHAAGCAPIGFNSLSASFSQAQLALLPVRSPGLCTRWSLCWGWFPLTLHFPLYLPSKNPHFVQDRRPSPPTHSLRVGSIPSLRGKSDWAEPVPWSSAHPPHPPPPPCQGLVQEGPWNAVRPRRGALVSFQGTQSSSGCPVMSNGDTDAWSTAAWGPRGPL